ncbi:hypothetical protein A5819_003817, partial [Enterococcus sp. 7E2_DIV0204]
HLVVKDRLLTFQMMIYRSKKWLQTWLQTHFSQSRKNEVGA